MIKRIKNITEVEIVLCGQSIFPNEYYTIQASEYVIWGSDVNVINAIINEIVIVNNGAEDFSDSVIGLKYLTDDLPKEILTKLTDTFMAQTNSVHETIIAESTGFLDFKIENYEGESYIYKYVKGGTIFVKNGEYGDYVEVDIVDKDNILGYGAGLILKKYCYKMYIKPDIMNVLECPFAPGKIPKGFYIRTIYHSVGSVNVEVYLTLHIFTNDADWYDVTDDDSSSSG